MENVYQTISKYQWLKSLIMFVAAHVIDFLIVLGNAYVNGTAINWHSFFVGVVGIAITTLMYLSSTFFQNAQGTYFKQDNPAIDTSRPDVSPKP